MSKTVTNKRQCEQHAKRLGCELDCQLIGHRARIDATAPSGYCFEEGLHCLSETIFRGETKTETMEVLYGEILQRLQLYPFLEKCQEGCDCKNE